MLIVRSAIAAMASFAVAAAALGVGPAQVAGIGPAPLASSGGVELRGAESARPSGTIEQPIIAGNGVRIHTQPRTSSTVVGLGYYGDEVYELEYIPGWEKVRLYRNGMTGWIAAQYLGTEPISV